MSETKQRSMPVLSPQRIQLAEQWRNDFVVQAEVGVTPQDIVDPAYWALAAAQFHPYDRIEVRLESGEWMADLVVLQVDRTWAKMHVLHFYELASVSEVAPAPEKYRIEWKGPAMRFAVIRISDGALLEKGLQDKDAAGVWLRQYDKTTAVT